MVNSRLEAYARPRVDPELRTTLAQTQVHDRGGKMDAAASGPQWLPIVEAKPTFTGLKGAIDAGGAAHVVSETYHYSHRH